MLERKAQSYRWLHIIVIAKEKCMTTKIKIKLTSPKSKVKYQVVCRDVCNQAYIIDMSKSGEKESRRIIKQSRKLQDLKRP